MRSPKQFGARSVKPSPTMTSREALLVAIDVLEECVKSTWNPSKEYNLSYLLESGFILRAMLTEYDKNQLREGNNQKVLEIKDEPRS